MFNVVVSGGLSDCSQRQKQMFLSQIQLVPFFLNTQERKDTANDKQSLHENTSTSLVQFWLQVTAAFPTDSCFVVLKEMSWLNN